MDKIKIILSGGGTGGHIYPAVAVAEALQRRLGDGVELLFVGAEGKMEMEKIPALGYRIEGLPVAGLPNRRLTARNLSLPFKVAASLRKARRVIRQLRGRRSGRFRAAMRAHRCCGAPSAWVFRR